MLFAQHLAEDGQRLLGQRLGLGLLALKAQAVGQAVVASSGVEVLLSQRAPPNVQRLLQQRLGLGVLALRGQVHRQVVVTGGDDQVDVDVVGFLAEPHGDSTRLGRRRGARVVGRQIIDASRRFSRRTERGRHVVVAGRKTVDAKLPEVVGDAGLLIRPGSTDDLADALLLILDNDNERSRLVAKGRQRSLLFNWDKTTAQTLKVYESVLS